MDNKFILKEVTQTYSNSIFSQRSHATIKT